MTYRLGIDLGGTKTEGILLDEKFEIVERKRLPTNQQEGYSSIINLIKNLVDDLKQKTDDSISIGVCTPGALSKQSGVIKNSNTQCLIGKDIKNDLNQSDNMIRYIFIKVKSHQELPTKLQNEKK